MIREIAKRTDLVFRTCFCCVASSKNGGKYEKGFYKACGRQHSSQIRHPQIQEVRGLTHLKGSSFITPPCEKANGKPVMYPVDEPPWYPRGFSAGYAGPRGPTRAPAPPAHYLYGLALMTHRTRKRNFTLDWPALAPRGDDMGLPSQIYILVLQFFQ